MADDTEDQEDEGGGESGGALGAALESGMTASPEAHDYARAILNRELGSSAGPNEEDDDLIHALQNDSDTARSVLQNARTRLLSLKYDPNNSIAKLTAGAALTAPTKTGNLGESMGNLGASMADYLQKKQNFNEANAEEADKYGLSLAGIDKGTLDARLALDKLRSQQQTGLAEHALTTLARPEAGETGQTAQFEGLLREAGYTPGSPQWQSAMQDMVKKQTHISVPASQIPPTTDQQAGMMARAKLIANYDAPPPTGFGANNPTLNPLWQAVTQLNPNYQAENYDVYKAGRERFTSTGQEAHQINALNTSIQHLNQLEGLIPSLKTGRWPVIQDALNKVGVNTGNAPLTSYQAVSSVLANEIERVMQANGGTGLERKDKEEMLSGKYTPTQLMGILDNVKGLFAGKLQALHQQAIPATHWNEDQWNQLLSPDTQTEMWLATHKNVPASALRTLKERPDTRPIFISHFGEPPVGYAGGGAVDDDPYASMIPKKPAASAAPTKESTDEDPYRLLEEGSTESQSPVTVGNVARSLEQGATAKWGDELNAAVEAATGHGDYDTDVANERQGPSELAAAHPVAEAGLEVAGGAGAATAGLAALRALSKLHGEGKLGIIEKLLGLAGKFAPDSQRARRVLGPVAGGAATGAVAGAGANTDPTRIGADTGLGAATGAVAGPLGALAARYGIATPASAIAQRIAKTNASPGERAIVGSLGTDPQTALTAIEQRLRSTPGTPATLGEASPPATQAVTRAALQQGTPAGEAYSQDLEARQAGAPGRVSDLVNSGLTPDPYQAQEAKLTQQLRENAKPLYDKAYAQFPSVSSPALTDLLGTPAGKQAARIAFRMMQNEGVSIGAPDALGMVQRPSLQYLDYVKRAYDDMISKAEGTGLNYAPNNAGRILRNQRSSLVSDIDQATTQPNGVSPYQQARQQYAGDLEVRDALRSGRDDFDSLTPDQLAQKVGGMSYAEKDAFRSGVAENLFQKLRTSGANSNPASRIIGQRGMQDKLAPLFDDPAKSRAFIQGLKQEMQLYDSGKSMLNAGNAGRDATAGTSLESPMREGLETLAKRGVGPTVGRAVTRAIGPGAAPDQVSSLMSRSGPAALTGIDQLRRAAAAELQRKGVANNLRNVGAFAGVPAAVQAETPQESAP